MGNRWMLKETQRNKERESERKKERKMENVKNGLVQGFNERKKSTELQMSI